MSFSKINAILNKQNWGTGNISIPRGGLGIFLTAVFKIADEKRRYLERLQGIISENYNVEMETHTGSRIAGDSILIFEREFDENEEEIKKGNSIKKVILRTIK